MLLASDFSIAITCALSISVKNDAVSGY
jgi:hypothetical protein